jgi:large subunit ribosomal protein L23
MDNIVKAVQTTEKGSRLSALNKYFVEVDAKASKPQIKEAVEKLFGVHVTAVNTANMKSGLRTVRGTRRQVRDSAWKRAIVTVKPGERIEIV